MSDNAEAHDVIAHWRRRAEQAEARLREYEEALKLANGSSRRTDDPGGIWIRFPDEAWEVIKPTIYRADG
jgi:hypothetical protein